MNVDYSRADAGGQKAVGQRFRLSCRSLVIAASVALQQLGTDVTSPLREHPPYVQLLDEPPERFSERERVGRWVLTTELAVPEDGKRMTGSHN